MSAERSVASRAARGAATIAVVLAPWFLPPPAGRDVLIWFGSAALWAWPPG